ncbi:MAG TPA: diguanylate cyclase [Nitrospirota bacterium]
MPVKKEKSIYKVFIISISLVIAATLAAVFSDMLVQTRRLIQEQNLTKARSLFNSIVMAREWNANYGGVYVEKKAGVESNPYLVNPDMKSADGRMFTKRNPALMVREISEYAEREGEFKLHITSLNLFNPRNKPDAFEEKALHLFGAKDTHELFQTEHINERAVFRYMAPLYIDRSCLQCHTKQGYEIGDVGGGISISFDIEDIQNELKRKTTAIIFFGVTTIVLLVGLIYFFTARLIKKFTDACRTIEEIAITDELTGIYNRRHILSRFAEEFAKAQRLGKDLGCIIADIDHFKAINDRQGHLAGDEVLKEVSSRIRRSIRIYDVLGRYGGEEFLILLPDADLESAWNFAERVRMEVREGTIRGNQVTISLGVTSLQHDDQSIDTMIKRADDELYKAKNNGRDRVEWTRNP